MEKFIITRCPCKMVGGRVASSVFSSSFHQVSRKINNAPGSRDKSERKLRLKETTGFEFSFQATPTHSFNTNWTILTTLQREGCCFLFFCEKLTKRYLFIFNVRNKSTENCNLYLLLNCSCLLCEFQIFLIKRMKLFE